MLHGCSGQLISDVLSCYLGRIQYMLHGCSGQSISDVLFVDCLNVILVEYSTCYMGVVVS